MSNETENKELETISKEDVKNIVEEKLKEKDALLEKEVNEKEALALEVKRLKDADEIEHKNIFGNGENIMQKKNSEFKEFLRTVPELRLKTGMSVPIPEQYFPEIVPTPGRTDILSQCKYQGNANSTVMYITRASLAPTGNWMGLTGGGTSTSLSAGKEAVNLDCFTVKVPVYDYQMINPTFDVIGYMKDEISRVIPKELAKQVLAGSGAPFTGIAGHSSVGSVSQTATGSLANLSLTDLRNMVAGIYPEFRTNDLKWYVDMSEEQTLYGVCDANNRVTDVTTGVSRILGYEVVALPTGILNGMTTSTTGSKHFVLANLKETVEYADLGGYKTEAFRTTSGLTTYEIYYWVGLGVRNPYSADIFKLHA